MLLFNKVFYGIPMNVNELKKHLNDASKEDLTKHILDLFKKNEFVKDYYKLKYDLEYKTAVFEKYKEEIQCEFFPKRGVGKARLSVAKKSISEFKKLSNDKEQIAGIMLFYVEMGVEFTNTYGDIDGSFYVSMEGMYEQVVKFIVKYRLESMFVDHCLEIVNDTNGIGWGFHDQLRVTYDEYFGDEDA
jgi:hypothetical protein